MTTPTKSDYQAALSTVQAGDVVMIQAAAPVFQPVIDANNVAIAALEAAMATYSPPPPAGLSKAFDAIQSWQGQLMAFIPTLEALRDQAAAMLPAEETQPA